MPDDLKHEETADVNRQTQASGNEQNPDDMSVEELFDEIQGLIDKLKSGTPLEESFELYEKGMNLVKVCNDKIDRVEKKMKTLEEEARNNGQS